MNAQVLKVIAQRLRGLVLATALMAVLVAPGAAQTYTATLTGTVSDPTGAAVPNVKVVATNQGTKLEYTARIMEFALKFHF